MLYDPKWETITKPDVFAIKSLIAWLEKQPPTAEYCFYDHGACLLHQYFSQAGIRPTWVGGYTYKTADNPRKSKIIPERLADIAALLPHTYGAALERARKYRDR